MLQRIIGAHPEVHTTSEPWIMLHPLYALKKNGLEADYSASHARRALDVFFGELPEGEDDYVEAIRRMYGSLYHRVLAQTGASYFLDKTPRYYLILPELRRTFPDACIISLVRHPLSVLASIISTWVRTIWLKLHRYRHDLLTAPACILENSPAAEVTDVVVRYEDVVQSPHDTIRKLCGVIGIEFQPSMITYGHSDSDEAQNWRFGDEESVKKWSHPTTQSLYKWKQMANHPQCWQLFRDYSKALGPSYFEKHGYNYEATLRYLEDLRPSGFSRKLVFTLDYLLEGSPERHASIPLRLQQSLIRSAWGDPADIFASEQS